ncbi:Acyltransferase calJ [Pseudocercospora fuligena]|uniref:Acyltransferase calJ n=1 Tax=Pseudocercospora fuligena TaxID=685502 RepID=A0A8H6RKF6_9PEZI|nr:Acyltransferase calJ [Pseudocercospora fuligena]
MASFDEQLGTATKKGEATIHGVLIKCVDKNGKTLYSKTAGYDSIGADAKPLRDDAVLKVASATKLITSVAFLQCVERGLINLDESISHILPEFETRDILESVEGTTCIKRKAANKITARQLLTHTTGLGYWFIHPLLVKWRDSGDYKKSNFVETRYDMPLLFEPGEGWLYGCNQDWMGVAIRRLYKTSFEEYLAEHVFKSVGRQAPFPTFHISRHPEYKARLMQGLARSKDGGLEPTEFIFGDNPDDEEGGGGLAMTMDDYAAVLQDLISDQPKLLKPETVAMMFEPQIKPEKTEVMKNLLQLRPAWDICSGPVRDEDVNHGLGGLLVQGEAEVIAQPKDLLVWGGSSNIIWFISKQLGVAGFFGTQLQPFSDPKAKELVNAWKTDFWTKYKSGELDVSNQRDH